MRQPFDHDPEIALSFRDELPVISAAVLYGKGVFTTIAVISGKPFLWDNHWQRLLANAGAIGLDISTYNKAAVSELLDRSIEREGIVDGRLRITFHDESEAPIWSGDGKARTRLSLIKGDKRPVPDEFRLTVSPYPANSRSPLAGVKSCSYLENVLALEEAKRRGFHEAVRLNEKGIITSGCMSNVFWLKDKKLFTPPLLTGCLPGTTREHILDNLECNAVEAGVAELENAEAIYITSAGVGIISATEFYNRKLSPNPHQILDLWPK